MKSRAALAIAVAGLFAAACGGAQPQPSSTPPSDPGGGSASPSGTPTCDDVVAHVKQLSIAASGATTDDLKQKAAQEVEPALVELADECEGGNGAAGWSPTFRRCVMATKSREDVGVCDMANANGPEPRP